jgi:hypothetical protein
MKVKKHPQLNMSNALTLPGVRALETVALFLLVACFPRMLSPYLRLRLLKTFAEWCLNKNNLS